MFKTNWVCVSRFNWVDYFLVNKRLKIMAAMIILMLVFLMIFASIPASAQDRFTPGEGGSIHDFTPFFWSMSIASESYIRSTTHQDCYMP